MISKTDSIVRLTDGCELHMEKPPVRLEDFTGRRFGDLVVVGYAGHEHLANGNWRHVWVAHCYCGHRWKVPTGALRRGQTQRCCSCSLKRLHLTVTKHGQSGTREYSSWRAMCKRGGSKVCRRWRNSVTDFIADMGSRPSLRYGVERIDPNEPYSPNNCRWGSTVGQRGRMFTIAGRTGDMGVWARLLGISREAVRLRLLKFPPEVALTAPKTPNGKHLKPQLTCRT